MWWNLLQKGAVQQRLQENQSRTWMNTNPAREWSQRFHYWSDLRLVGYITQTGN
jgi:hypothetical protein